MGTGRGHDWFLAVVTAVFTVVINVAIIAFSYGQFDHRLESLEKQDAQLREDWKAARERIEKALLGNEKK